MAIQILQLKKVKQPLRNTESSLSLFDDRMKYVSASLYEMIRRTPELISMLDSVVSDHFMGAVDFYDSFGKPLGPTKIKQVQSFWEDMNVQNDAFYGQALDYFVDGSSFGWHANAAQFLTTKQKEQFVKMKELNPEVAQFATEQAHMPRKISYIAASTMSIKNDEYGEVFYVQETAGQKVRWETDQIVHIKLMDFNGEIRGFSALKALIKEISMMYLLKENIVAKLENGGSPDYIISLKGANGSSKARFQRLRTALESFSHLRKSHGNMPIDAEVSIHPLGTDLKDMEYRELAMFIISEFALALGLPTSRVPFLMTGSGGSSNKGELSGNAEDSYQTKINSRRKQWENSWNKIFKKAGFMFKFRRDNLQDDVRETQASVQRSAFVTGVQDSLFKSKKRLRLPAHLALLSGRQVNITEEDIEDVPEEDQMPFAPAGAIGGIGGEMQPGKLENSSKVTKDKSAAKEKTAFNNGRNS